MVKVSFVVECHTRLLEEILARLDGLCKAALGDRTILHSPSSFSGKLPEAIVWPFWSSWGTIREPIARGSVTDDRSPSFIEGVSNEEGRPVFGSCHLGRCARM